jgi:hypothetical protein
MTYIDTETDRQLLQMACNVDDLNDTLRGVVELNLFVDDDSKPIILVDKICRSNGIEYQRGPI